MRDLESTKYLFDTIGIKYNETVENHFQGEDENGNKIYKDFTCLYIDKDHMASYGICCWLFDYMDGSFYGIMAE